MSDENQVILRLNSLMKVGYIIDMSVSQEVGDALWLKHPAISRVKKPELILYSDGLLVSNSVGDEDNQLRIKNKEGDIFINFIRNVPHPNLWEKTAEFRTNVAAWLILLAIGSLGGFIFNAI